MDRNGKYGPRVRLPLLFLIAVVGLLAGCSDSIEGPAPTGVGTIGGEQDAQEGFERLYSTDMAYLGAFRAPDKDAMSFALGAMAYVPDRNTLVIVGKEKAQNWFEISIPQPIISSGKVPGELNEAIDISGWMPVMDPLFGKLGTAKTLGGLTFYRDRFWIGSYEFYNVAGRDNLGITTVDTNFGDARGAWRVGPANVNQPIKNVFHANKTHNDVMVIPENWTRKYTPGKRLAGGRHRGAGAFGGGKGPALYAFGANPNAADGASLNGVPLMYFPENGVKWPGYRKADSYHSVWIWKGKRQAVLVSSTKGLGPNFYGPGPACTPDKGWHAHPYEPRLYFVDVRELGEVTQGKRAPWDVLPYEEITPNDVVWSSPTDPNGDPNCRSPYLRDFAFDEARGILYASQPKAYTKGASSNRMIIHAWQVN